MHGVTEQKPILIRGEGSVTYFTGKLVSILFGRGSDIFILRGGDKNDFLTSLFTPWMPTRFTAPLLQHNLPLKTNVSVVYDEFEFVSILCIRDNGYIKVNSKTNATF